MKKAILMLFTVAIASVNVVAQEAQEKSAPKKSPEERAENMTKRMTKELALTADQQTKVKSLILTREKDREQGVNDKKGEREKMDAEWKAILTPEQYQKFQQKREEGKEKRQEKHKEGSHGASSQSGQPSQQ